MESEYETINRRFVEDFMETMECSKDEADKFLALASGSFEGACIKLIRHRKGW